MYLQKVIAKKTFFYLFFVGILKVNDENSRIRIHYSEAWIRGSRSGSAPKCHGSATLSRTVPMFLTSLVDPEKTNRWRIQKETHLTVIQGVRTRKLSVAGSRFSENRLGSFSSVKKPFAILCVHFFTNNNRKTNKLNFLKLSELRPTYFYFCEKICWTLHFLILISGFTRLHVIDRLPC